MSAREVYTALEEGDEIRNVTITEPIDLTNAAVRTRVATPEPRSIVFDHVTFEAGLAAKGGEVAANPLFRDTTFHSIVAKHVKWRGKVRFEGGEVLGWAIFDHNIFDAIAQFNVVTFGGGANFRGSVFSQEAEFLQCTFGGDGTAGFSNVHFLGPAHFNETEFQALAKFESAVFDGDASFVRMRASRYFQFDRHNTSLGWRYYPLAVWAMGALSIALLGLTLANTSPVLSKLIGKVVF